MVIQSLNTNQDPFITWVDNEKILNLKFYILVSSKHSCMLQIVIDLMLHLQITCKLKQRSSNNAIRWETKSISTYIFMALKIQVSYQKNQDITIVGYPDSGYIIDSHNGISQTDFMVIYLFHRSHQNRFQWLFSPIILKHHIHMYGFAE